MLPVILFLSLIVIPFFINRSVKSLTTGVRKFYTLMAMFSVFGLCAIINTEYKIFVGEHMIFVNVLFFIAWMLLWFILSNKWRNE